MRLPQTLAGGVPPSRGAPRCQGGGKNGGAAKGATGAADGGPKGKGKGPDPEWAKDRPCRFEQKFGTCHGAGQWCVFRHGASNAVNCEIEIENETLCKLSNCKSTLDGIYREIRNDNSGLHRSQIDSQVVEMQNHNHAHAKFNPFNHVNEIADTDGFSLSSIEDGGQSFGGSADSDDFLPSILSVDILSLIRSYAAEPSTQSGLARVNGCVTMLPFGRSARDKVQTGISISFCKDIDEIKFEMDERNHMNTSTSEYKNRKSSIHKIPYQKTTEQIMEHYADIEIDRVKRINKAFRVADELARELNIPTILTIFIVDTGAGLNLKCYAKGLSTREINDLTMMSANGTVSTNQVTTVKFRKISDQDCVVLDNCPNVLSVGQLVSQGYDFLWLSDPKLKRSKDRSNLRTSLASGPADRFSNVTPFNADALLMSNAFEQCYLITPSGGLLQILCHTLMIPIRRGPVAVATGLRGSPKLPVQLTMMKTFGTTSVSQTMSWSCCPRVPKEVTDMRKPSLRMNMKIMELIACPHIESHRNRTSNLLIVSRRF